MDPFFGTASPVPSIGAVGGLRDGSKSSPSSSWPVRSRANQRKGCRLGYQRDLYIGSRCDRLVELQKAASFIPRLLVAHDHDLLARQVPFGGVVSPRSGKATDHVPTRFNADLLFVPSAVGHRLTKRIAAGGAAPWVYVFVCRNGPCDRSPERRWLVVRFTTTACVVRHWKTDGCSAFSLCRM